MNAHRGLLIGKGVRLGEGCIRYSKADKIDFDVVKRMLKAAQETTGPVC